MMQGFFSVWVACRIATAGSKSRVMKAVKLLSLRFHPDKHDRYADPAGDCCARYTLAFHV